MSNPTHLYVLPKLADAILGIYGTGTVSHGGIFALKAVYYLASLPTPLGYSIDAKEPLSIEQVVSNKIQKIRFTTLPGRPIPLGVRSLSNLDVPHSSAIGVVTVEHSDGLTDHIFGVMRDFDRSAPTYHNPDELIDQARIVFSDSDTFYCFCFALLELEVF